MHKLALSRRLEDCTVCHTKYKMPVCAALFQLSIMEICMLCGGMRGLVVVQCLLISVSFPRIIVQASIERVPSTAFTARSSMLLEVLSTLTIFFLLLDSLCLNSSTKSASTFIILFPVLVAHLAARLSPTILPSLDETRI